MLKTHCAAAEVVVVLAHTGILAVVAVAGVQHYEAGKLNSGTGSGEERLEDIAEGLLGFEEFETWHRGDSEGLVRPMSL